MHPRIPSSLDFLLVSGEKIIFFWGWTRFRPEPWADFSVIRFVDFPGCAKSGEFRFFPCFAQVGKRAVRCKSTNAKGDSKVESGQVTFRQSSIHSQPSLDTLHTYTYTYTYTHLLLAIPTYNIIITIINSDTTQQGQSLHHHLISHTAISSRIFHQTL